MNNDQDDFLKELLADFRVEAFEHYQSIINGLISLEKTNGGTDEFCLTIEKIFRETHSLKGAARTVNLPGIEKLCMSMESRFNSLKKGEIQLTPQLMDAFHVASNALKQLLDSLDNGDKPSTGQNINMIVQHLENAHMASAAKIEVKEKPLANIPMESTDQERPIEKESDTIRISSAKQIDILNRAEDFISIKNKLEFYRKKLLNLYGSVRNEALLNVSNDMVNCGRQVSRMIDDLIIDIKSSLLLPFSSLLNIIPKIVWDLSKEYSKEISVEITGDNIEIDRRILEELKDPLIHLIRNNIDHGIETPDVRIAKGKNAGGKILIAVTHDADRKISIRIEDDGSGIDKEKVIQSSIKNGLIDDETAKTLSNKETFSLIFRSGVSTKEFVTDISGRGLGMAIVAEKVAKLGGTIEVKSVVDKGTSFLIRVPQTIATFRGIVVSVEEQRMIIPSINLDKAIRVDKNAILTVGTKKAINYSEESIPFLNLSDVLGIDGKNRIVDKNTSKYINVLILNYSQKRMAFAVDEILNEQEGIIKSLGSQLVKVKMISGVTIQGNSRVVPIIEISELFEAALKTKTLNVSSFEIDNQPIKKKILIAEDSITVRTMLRNFVENAGYIVKTAVNGMDAYNMVMEEDFDLVVSDIEMPKMNGFELTEKIREHSEHSGLPVVLVTALDSKDDQKRGMEAGANAYIVKASFEKSNLIETIKRLI